MVEQKDFRLRFAAIKERTIRKACHREKMWLRVRHGLRPDYTTEKTCTEVYMLTEPKGAGIHLFSIEDNGLENPETMVVENIRLTYEQLEDQIRQFVKRQYSELENVKVNFIRPNRP